MTTDEIIRNMLNKPYTVPLRAQGKRYICWSFCRQVYSLFGLRLHLQYQKGLTRIAGPVVPCIVLFRAAMDWHSGVVWPDGLHFIHACPKNMFDPDPGQEYIVCKDRLTAWPYNLLIEGYYHSNSKLKTKS